MHQEKGGAHKELLLFCLAASELFTDEHGLH
jgi:hypothetical protein